MRMVTAVGLCCLLAGVSFATAEPMDRPAVRNARPDLAVLLGVTRAGSRLVAVGERGIVILSDDEGRTWLQATDVPTSTTLTAVHFADPRRGYAVGHFGVLLRSVDGGVSWQRQSVESGAGHRGEGPDRPFLDVFFPTPQRGFVVGAFGTILATADGGNSWGRLSDRLAPGEVRHLYAVRASAAELYVVGEQGAIYRSRDDGGSFVALPSPYQGSFFGMLLGPAPGQVLVFGLRGRAFSSNDAGARWRDCVVPTPAALVSGLVLADGSLLLADQGGRLFRSPSADPRAHRDCLFAPSPLRLPAGAQSMAQLGPDAVLAVGARGVLPALFTDPR